VTWGRVARQLVTAGAQDVMVETTVVNAVEVVIGTLEEVTFDEEEAPDETLADPAPVDVGLDTLEVDNEETEDKVVGATEVLALVVDDVELENRPVEVDALELEEMVEVDDARVEVDALEVEVDVADEHTP
jgi:hypothetical protein